MGRKAHAISGNLATVDNTGFSNPWINSVGWLDINTGLPQCVPKKPLTICGAPRALCSGTLISPTVVLSAGHCFDFKKSGNIGTFTIPNRSPDPTHHKPQGHSYSIDNVHIINDGSDRPHDIAVAVLKSPVPKSVVAHYLPISTRSPTNAFNEHALVKPAYIGGFGGTTPTGFDPGAKETEDGNRRWGSAPSDVKPALDFCDKSLGEGHCNNDWEWEARRIANPQTEEGDSGGPLVMTTSDGRLVIVGVDSGVYEDPYTPPTTVWAPTGAPGGTNNGMWIFKYLGGDKDGDGIPEDADNCPASVCIKNGKDPADCANTDQADLDGDGVGDKCDNCPPSFCEELASLYPGLGPPGVYCKNPSQADDDGDGIGNACDLCPESDADIDNPTADSDKDGVGDVCDTCDQYDPYTTCKTDSNCSNGTCLIEPGLADGRCSKETDHDNDGVPDACDECPGLASSDRTNSNDIAEQREHDLYPTVKTLADSCDPVPLERFKEQEPLVMDLSNVDQFVPGDGKGPDDVVRIDQNEWLGAALANPTVTTTVQRRVAYRYCSCIDSFGNRLPLAKCVMDVPNVICPDKSPLTDRFHWGIPTLVDASGNPAADPLTGITLATESFQTSQQSAIRSVTWRWRHDLIAHQVSGEGDCLNGGPFGCRTYGVLLTRTLKTPAYASSREADHMLGDVFNLVITPAIVLGGIVPGRYYCKGPCLHWITPDYLKDPPFLGFTNMFTEPVLVATQPSGEVTALVGPDRSIDITSYLDDATRRLVGSDALWLTAVEPFNVARYTGSAAVRSGLHAVVLDRDFTGVAPTPIAITSSGVSSEAGILPGPAPRSPQVADPAPPVLHDVRGAYSAVEGSVYMVGGTRDSGYAANSVWRWSLAKRQWNLVDIQGGYVPSSRVLSIGYDASGQHLYVLDLDDNDVREPPRKTRRYARLHRIGPDRPARSYARRQRRQRYARLYRIDLDRHISTPLALFRYRNTNGIDAIAVMPDGLLALVVGRRHAYTVWRLDGRGDHAVFHGVTAGAGQVIDGPVMGEDRLYLPVMRHDKLHVVGLGRERFRGNRRCSGL